MFDEFFKPYSVAVIGASREPEKVGYAVLKNLIENKFSGKIYPVNPKASEILNCKTYANIGDIQDRVDLAIIIVPAKFVPKTLEECGEKKVKGCIIISAGFKEAGSEGYKLENQLTEIAKRQSMRILGPNCLGLINPHFSLNASFAASMPEKGNIAFMSQSGALCTAILDWAIAERIGFSKFVSLGNKADLNEIDLLKAWADDEESKVIIAYLEGIKDGNEFMKVAEEVTKKKPLIIIKSGVTNAGARAVSSHTGSLAGSDMAYESAFKQTGVIRAKSIEELFDYAIAFAYQPVPAGDKFAIITNAGGPGIMATDSLEKSELKLSSFQTETIETLRKNLPPSANIYNPVDVLGDAQSDRYELALKLLLQNENVDGIIILLTPQAMTEIKKTAETISEGAKNSKKPVLACFMGEKRVKEGIEILQDNKIPNYYFPERAVSSLRAMVDYGNWLKLPKQEIKKFDVDKEKVREILNYAKSNKHFKLGDLEVKEIISSYGFKIPKAGLATTSEEAVSLTNKFGYPVVLKIASPDIIHKSDVGGVRIGLQNAEQVSDAFEAILMRVKRLIPQAEILGCAIQEMVKKGKEVIIGMNRDPQFGPLVMFGLGGIYVETLKDVSFRIAPITEYDAKKMMQEIKGISLLRGVRGEKPSDLEVVVESILKISQLVCDFSEIVELDINPLVVYEKGEGAVAIDARLTIKEE